MSTLADLFDGDRATRMDAAPVEYDARSAARLAEMLGGARRTVAPPADDTPRLINLVQSAVSTATPVVVAGSGSKKHSARGRKRTDWLSVIAAAVAVVVMSATGVLAGIQFASASPAAGALQSLTADEAAVTNTQQALAAATSRIESDVAAGLQDAARLEPALAAVAGYSDETARAAALQALADYRASLEAVTLPGLPPTYSRPALEADSLAEVGAAINAVQALSTELSELTEQVRALRVTVTSLRDRFIAQVTAFGATFPAWAEMTIGENEAAGQDYQDAVWVGAASVPRSQVDGQLGVDAMLAFPPLVDELRAEHQRILDVIAEEEEQRRNAGSGGSGGSGGAVDPAPQPTDPGTGVVDPGTGTDPGPVEPPPGDTTE